MPVLLTGSPIHFANCSIGSPTLGVTLPAMQFLRLGRKGYTTIMHNMKTVSEFLAKEIASCGAARPRSPERPLELLALLGCHVVP